MIPVGMRRDDDVQLAPAFRPDVIGHNAKASILLTPVGSRCPAIDEDMAVTLLRVTEAEEKAVSMPHLVHADSDALRRLFSRFAFEHRNILFPKDG